MMYLWWYDDAAKKPLDTKLSDGIDAYLSRFDVRPNVVLVNADEMSQRSDIVVRVRAGIGKNNYWFGVE